MFNVKRAVLVGLIPFVVALLIASSWVATGQVAQQSSNQAVKVMTAYPVVPISATAAAGSAVTLTIPAPVPASYSNYVCYLAIEGSNNNTALAVTNVVTTSTNFNSFAAKFSTPGAASSDTGVLVLLNATAPGCAKSAAPGVATTFTSPTSTDEAYAWYATYFQAP